MQSMRIVLADGQSNVRFALRALLERQPEVQVVDEAADLGELLSRIGDTCPDLLVLDWRLRGAAQADVLSILRQLCPGLAVIALSGRPEDRRAALVAGVDAYVCKTEPPEKLLAAITARRQ
jgi:two-component system nitrate/nitrite response regulator NarL